VLFYENGLKEDFEDFVVCFIAQIFSADVMSTRTEWKSIRASYTLDSLCMESKINSKSITKSKSKKYYSWTELLVTF